MAIKFEYDSTGEIKEMKEKLRLENELAEDWQLIEKLLIDQDDEQIDPSSESSRHIVIRW